MKIYFVAKGIENEETSVSLEQKIDKLLETFGNSLEEKSNSNVDTGNPTNAVNLTLTQTNQTLNSFPSTQIDSMQEWDDIFHNGIVH